MKHRILLALTSLFTLLATSCWQAPTPPPARDVKVLATVQAILDTSGGATAQLTPVTERSTRSALPDTAITFSRKFSSLFEDETESRRSIYRIECCRGISGARYRGYKCSSAFTKT